MYREKRAAAWYVDHQMFLDHRPAEPLAFYVEKLWYCEGYQVPHAKERVLPNGRFQLVIDLSGFAAPPLVVGIRSEYGVIETAALQCIIGVVFRAGGARSLIDASADEFYNREIPLDLVWGSSAARLRDRLRETRKPSARFRVLEAALLERVKSRELHPAVEFGLAEFQRAPHIRGVLDVTRDAGLSRRRFAQLFREQVGLTPKLYCRVHRFQDVVRKLSSGVTVDWADVALAGGYCDQAHLAHEFRAFSGISPGAWLDRDRPFPNHLVID
jgi:AraC-like DNA-binding protein